MSLLDGLDDLLQDWEDHKHLYPGHIKIEKIEIVTHTDGHPVSVEEEIGLSEHDAVTQWLVLDDGSTSTMKLLLIETNDPISTDSEGESTKVVGELFRAAGLPFGGLTNYSSRVCSFAKAPSRTTRSDGTASLSFRYYLTTLNWSFTWVFDQNSKNVRGILLYDPVDRFRALFVKALSENPSYIGQPMVLGVLISTFHLALLEETNYVQKSKVWSVRDDTGLFSWKDGTLDLIEVDESRMDYAVSSREVALLSGIVKQLELQLHLASRFASFMLEEHDKFMQKFSSGGEDADLTKAEDVKQAIEVLKDRSSWILNENQITSEVLTAMLSAIYNLIAQKDSKVGLQVADHSRTLAVESKRDSSSMKTIAAVTMAFLPGTFVASLFAMPMFDWNTPPGSNVNTHTFWIYWSVTVPLTVSVFFFWWTWLRFKTARDKREDKAIAESEQSNEKTKKDGESESSTDSVDHLSGTPSHNAAERPENMWRRLGAVYRNRHSRQRRDTEMS